MNQQKATEVIKNLQSGVIVPNATILMTYGYLSGVKERHLNAFDVEKVKSIDKVLSFLKSKAK